MSKISLIKLVRISRDFFGKEWDTLTKSDKLKWIEKYRKIENETNAMIAKYDSVEQWYMSGEGRLWIIEGGEK